MTPEKLLAWLDTINRVLYRIGGWTDEEKRTDAEALAQLRGMLKEPGDADGEK